EKRFWFPEENRFIALRLSAAAIRTIDKNGISSAIRQMRKSGKRV
ncbi:MAG: L28 family ribosomal protein, partial [Chlamydiota bacterium]